MKSFLFSLSFLCLGSVAFAAEVCQPATYYTDRIDLPDGSVVLMNPRIMGTNGTIIPLGWCGGTTPTEHFCKVAGFSTQISASPAPDTSQSQKQLVACFRGTKLESLQYSTSRTESLICK